ncbi:MAG TPA: carbohydrate-binding family 9-like protein [Chthoniobacteraceae bacterium]|nr:carbohydrate-binding family 9-like protein [Chthoniobacteraceae bacterium]
MINPLPAFRNLVFAILHALALPLAADPPANAQEKPWHVVIASDAPGMTRFAGEELSRLLSKALGREVPTKATSDEPGEAALVLGAHPHLKALGIDPATLPRDGFVIRTHGNHLHIVGRDGDPGNVAAIMASGAWHRRDTLPERGTLYGVYEFLERYVGARFYFPGRYGTIIPRLGDWHLPEIDLRLAPVHPARSMGHSGQLFPGFDEDYPGDTIEAKAWYFKTLDKLRLRQQTRYLPHDHGLSRFGYVERFGESHPEYFALMSNGRRYNDPHLPHPAQLCFSSGIREEIYQDAKAYLTGQSARSRNVRRTPRSAYEWPLSVTQPGYFNIMPQDGFSPCNCAACQVHFQGTRYNTLKRESSSGFLWDFFIDLAERLTREGVPGRLTTMAYPPYNRVPKRKIPENLEVSFCPAGADAVRDFDAVHQAVRGWYEATGKKRIWLWNNVGKYGELKMPGVPFIIPRATGHYYKTLSPYISGAFVSLPQDFYLFKYINAYVANKVFWDPTVDVEELLAEHDRLMFGSAAETMGNVYRRFEEHWTKAIRGNTVETDLGETAVPPSDYTLWNEIYSGDEMQRLNALFDRAEQQAAAEPGPLERVRFMRQNLFGPLVNAREAYTRVADQVRHLKADAPMLKAGEVSAAAWNEAEALHLHPYDDRQPSTVETVVRVLRDERHLHLLFECQEPEIGDMVAETHEDDSTMIYKESCVEVFLNPSGDRMNYFQISVNPLGAVTDAAGVKQGQSEALDREWQSGVRCKTEMGKAGWRVEMAIPLERLGTINPEGFPVNFTRARVIQGRKKELFSWSPYLEHGFHDLGNFGTLHFNDTRPVNLIRNGGFSGAVGSQKIADWRGARKGTETGGWEITGDRFVDGGRSLKLEGAGKGGTVSVRQDLPDLQADTEYAISFYVRTEAVQPANSSCGAFISLWEKKNRFFPVSPLVGTLPWQRMEYRLRTGPETNRKVGSYLLLAVRQATGTVWFDDVRVTPVAVD